MARNGRRERARRDLRREILACIARWYRERGVYPTVREIQAELRVSSPSVVDYHLRRLEEAGIIRREGRRSRGIRLLQWPDGEPLPYGLRRIPLVGAIAAGHPLPAPTGDPAGWLLLPETWLPPGEDFFALQVQGTSMLDALIGDGDLLIVKPVPQVENGQMAVVWLSDRQEVALKYVYCTGDRVLLKSAHPAFPPFEVPAAAVQIRGQVIQVVRRLDGRIAGTV